MQIKWAEDAGKAGDPTVRYVLRWERLPHNRDCPRLLRRHLRQWGNLFNIEFVTIGNPGNAADTEDGNDNQTGVQNFGSVPDQYRIGKFEISEDMIGKENAQSASDGSPLNITHNGFGANKPAGSVSWFEAAKFINWLNTSSGSTEACKFDGAGTFQLWQSGDEGYNPNNLFRNSLAIYFLASVDEWYKAAYYDPTLGVYYDYPTGSNSVPDGIDFAGDTTFDVVFREVSGRNNPAPNDITDVGVLSPYGTAGQGGNVYEREETDFDLVNDSSSSRHGIRGSSWRNRSLDLLSSYRFGSSPTDEFGINGFRVASIPEPTTSALALAALCLAMSRRRSF